MRESYYRLSSQLHDGRASRLQQRALASSLLFTICSRCEFLIKDVFNDFASVSAVILCINEHPLEQLRFSIFFGQLS